MKETLTNNSQVEPTDEAFPILVSVLQSSNEKLNALDPAMVDRNSKN